MRLHNQTTISQNTFPPTYDDSPYYLNKGPFQVESHDDGLFRHYKTFFLI